MATSTEVLIPYLPEFLSYCCLIVHSTFQSSHVTVCWLVLSSELLLISHFTSKSLITCHPSFSYEWDISVPLLQPVSVHSWLVLPCLPCEWIYTEVLH